jgi:hypothetical protein
MPPWLLKGVSRFGNEQWLLSSWKDDQEVLQEKKQSGLAFLGWSETELIPVPHRTMLLGCVLT